MSHTSDPPVLRPNQGAGPFPCVRHVTSCILGDLEAAVKLILNCFCNTPSPSFPKSLQATETLAASVEHLHTVSQDSRFLSGYRTQIHLKVHYSPVQPPTCCHTNTDCIVCALCVSSHTHCPLPLLLKFVMKAEASGDLTNLLFLRGLPMGFIEWVSNGFIHPACTV